MHAAEDEQDTLMPNDQVVIANMWPESRYLLPLSVISQVHADAEDDHEGGRGEFGEEVVDHGFPFGGRFV
ncbi:MAG: hypothetical protein ACLTKG_05200 [Collinsella intestinalis]